MAHKTFGRHDTDEEVEAPEEVSFDVAGEDNITCRRKANGKLLIELVGKVDSSSISDQSEGILQVFDVTVLTSDGENPEGYTGKRHKHHTTAEIQQAEENDVEPGIDPTSSLGRLDHVLNDPNTEIGIEELAEIVGWLVEQYTNRPTKSASNSPTGVSSTNRTPRRERRTQDRTIAKETRRGSSTSSTVSSSSSA